MNKKSLLKAGLICLVLLSGVTAMRFWSGTNGYPNTDNAAAGHIPKEIRRLKVKGYLNAVAWSADGSLLAGMGQFGSVITLFETKTWKELNRFERMSAAYSANSLEFIYDNTLLTSTPVGDYSNNPEVLSDSRYTRLDYFSLIDWDPVTGKRVRYFPDVENPVHDPVITSSTRTFTVSRDGVLVAGTPLGDVLLYDARTAAFLRTLKVPVRPSESWSDVVREGQARSRNHLAFLPDSAFSVAFSPNGKELAVGTMSGLLHIYDVNNGTILHSFIVYPDQNHTCTSLAYSPDGRRIAVGNMQSSDDGFPQATAISRSATTIAVSIIDSESGAILASLEGTPEKTFHDKYKSDPTRTVSWSPVENILAVGDDTALRFWRIEDTSVTLLLAVKIKHGAYKTAFSPQGLLAATENDEIVIYQ